VSLEKARSKWLESSKKVLDGKDIWLYNNVEALEDDISKEDKTVSRVLSEKEILLFWKRIDSINQLSAITKLALKLILLTGIQKEDLLLATWDDININKRSWLLNSKEEVFLNSLSVEMLLEVQDFEHHTAYSNTALKQAIIDSNNKVINLSPNTLDRALSDKGCERLGINPFLPNDLAETHKQLVKNNKREDLPLDEGGGEFIAEYIKSLVST
jgi:integrase